MPEPTKWTQISQKFQKILKFDQNETKSLQFVKEEDNDFQEGSRGTDFVHVLQLEDECDLNDI